MTLKLKRTPGLYLVGFMASGKSTVGRTLADELGWSFSDLDSEIETQYGQTIAQIFAERGESFFRDIENEAIRKRVRHIEAGTPTVVALGGGAFIQPRNWELIQNNGVTVWLDCPLHYVQKRIGSDTSRPLAGDRDGLIKLFEDRRPLYGKADFRIEISSDDVYDAVQEILKLPIF